MADNIYILKKISAKLMLDSIPRYKFIDGGDKKEKRNILSGLSYTINLELFDEDSINNDKGLPDSGEINIDHNTPAINSSGELDSWFTRNTNESVLNIKSKTQYYAVPTVPGPPVLNPRTGNMEPDPPENTEWLKDYIYPKIDITFYTSSKQEGIDYISVPDWDWKISNAYIKEDPSIGKIRRHVVLKGKWKYLVKQCETTVDLDK